MQGCRWCGKAVPPKAAGVPGRQRIYCSLKCRAAAREGRKLGYDKPYSVEPKACVGCGTSFRPKTRIHTYCSDACYRKTNNATRRGKRGGANYYRELFVLERGGVCQKCGGDDELNLHHVLPITQGGQHTPQNVLVLCRPCHLAEHRPTPRVKHVDRFWPPSKVSAADYALEAEIDRRRLSRAKPPLQRPIIQKRET